MWEALALGLGKSILDEQNRKRDIESNIITQRYAPWTGQRADFSAIGGNKSGDNMVKAIGAGLLESKAADKSAEVAARSDMASNEARSSNGLMDAMGSAPKSSFADIARAPATQAAPSPVASVAPAPASSMGDMFPARMSGETPLMLQGAQPQAQPDYWAQMAGMKSAPYTQPQASNVPAGYASNWARFR